MGTHIIGKRIDPLDHLTKPEWAATLRRARATDPKIRDRSSYGIGEFLSILKAAEAGRDGR